MKVLLSALACEPGKGSEPEVGFRTMLAAASRHDVWVLTLPESVPAIERAVEGDPRAARIHLETIGFDSKGRPLDELSPVLFHLGYDRWQKQAATLADRLERDIGFDVVHHVTLASYWTRAGVAVLRKPLVWGPIGGGVTPPPRLIPELGLSGTVEAMARMVGRPLVALLPAVRETQRVATVTLAQNPDTGRRLRSYGSMRLLSNALAVELQAEAEPGRRTTDLLFVGRLVPWKAPLLALRALRYARRSDAILRFCGSGPERARLERAAVRWGLTDRIRFEGWIPRTRLLPLIAHAGALIHPAVHEEAGLCIAEALSLGTPVVVLDHGGPAQIVGQYRGTPSALVAPRSPEVTARKIAAAIDAFLDDPPPIPRTAIRCSTSFEAEVLRAYATATSEP